MDSFTAFVADQLQAAPGTAFLGGRLPHPATSHFILVCTSKGPVLTFSHIAEEDRMATVRCLEVVSQELRDLA